MKSKFITSFLQTLLDYIKESIKYSKSNKLEKLFREENKNSEILFLKMEKWYISLNKELSSLKNKLLVLSIINTILLLVLLFFIFI